MISAQIRIPDLTVNTHVPLLEWQDCTDVVFDYDESTFDGECAVHDGCRSIL
ncbi:hypothetical protein [Rhodoglobus aureus]|uniref:hypothetical protein n=1 Tax=Rhodoglobus aureus TaxID=191497 RepID=UPI0031D1CCB2